MAHLLDPRLATAAIPRTAFAAHRVNHRQVQAVCSTAHPNITTRPTILDRASITTLHLPNRQIDYGEMWQSTRSKHRLHSTSTSTLFAHELLSLRITAPQTQTTTRSVLIGATRVCRVATNQTLFLMLRIFAQGAPLAGTHGTVSLIRRKLLSISSRSLHGASPPIHYVLAITNLNARDHDFRDSPAHLKLLNGHNPLLLMDACRG